MAFLLDDLLLAPVKLPVWLAQRLRQMTVEEATDESKVQQELLENQMRRELDEISEEECRDQETRLMGRLDEICRLKEEERSRQNRQNRKGKR